MNYFFYSFVLFATFFVSFAGFCHEEEPSILDFEIKEDIISIEIQTYLEVLSKGDLNNFDLNISDHTNKSEQSFDQNLIGDQISKLFFQNWPLLRAKFFFKANQDTLDLKLKNVKLVPGNSNADSMALFVRIDALVPYGSDFITFRWDENLGDLVIREQGNTENLYSDYLSKGTMSSKIYLQKEKLLSKPSQFFSFLTSGIYHIVPIGYDHILFIVGLYLFSQKLSTLALQVSLFTLSHSISLVLSVLGFISIPSSVIEPIIAISIIYIGLENCFLTEKNSYRGILIFAFGLLHGLGFASVLTSLKLPSSGIFLPLLGFNIGVEIGQILVLILCFFVFGYWFKEKIWYRSRVTKPISVVLVLIGSFWFISRVI